MSQNERETAFQRRFSYQALEELETKKEVSYIRDFFNKTATIIYSFTSVSQIMVVLHQTTLILYKHFNSPSETDDQVDKQLWVPAMVPLFLLVCSPLVVSKLRAQSRFSNRYNNKYHQVEKQREKERSCSKTVGIYTGDVLKGFGATAGLFVALVLCTVPETPALITAAITLIPNISGAHSFLLYGMSTFEEEYIASRANVVDASRAERLAITPSVLSPQGSGPILPGSEIPRSQKPRRVTGGNHPFTRGDSKNSRNSRVSVSSIVEIGGQIQGSKASKSEHLSLVANKSGFTYGSGQQPRAREIIDISGPVPTEGLRLGAPIAAPK